MRKPRIAHRYDGCGHFIRCPDGYLTSAETADLLGVPNRTAQHNTPAWLERIRTKPWYHDLEYRGIRHTHRVCYVPVPLVQYITLAFAYEIHLDRPKGLAVPAEAIKQYMRGTIGERLFAMRAVEVNVTCLWQLLPRDHPLRAKLLTVRDELRQTREWTIAALRGAPVPFMYGTKAKQREFAEWHERQAFAAGQERRSREMAEYRNELEGYLNGASNRKRNVSAGSSDPVREGSG